MKATVPIYQSSNTMIEATSGALKTPDGTPGRAASFKKPPLTQKQSGIPTKQGTRA